MTTQRITSQTKANLLAAEQALLITSLNGQGFMVKLVNKGLSAFVSGSWGPITYPTVAAARRAVSRIRSDLAVTSFQ